MPSLSLSRRHLLIAAAFAPVLAHAQRKPQELKDFTFVKPQQPTEGTKIEVLEFFLGDLFNGHGVPPPHTGNRRYGFSCPYKARSRRRP
jgi:hypothetical protein